VLQVKPIGVHDAFFDLGGDSLRAAQIAERLRRLAGRDLPVGFLQRASTPARTARILREEKDGAADPFLVPVRAEGDLPPLIICPPGGGIDIRFLKLASFLSERQPVYLLRPAGLDGHSVPHDTLDAMVEAYADSLAIEFGERPLRLLGACRGTFVAMALARRAVDRGAPPDALIVVDLPLPDRSITHHVVSSGNADRAARIGLRRWLDLRTARLRGYLKNRWLNAEIVRRVTAANDRAFEGTALVAYGGRALVVESIRPAAERHRFTAWRDLLVGEYAHVCMQGSTHTELMSGRHASELGRVLREWLGE
jgi:thioesterase domain-containing protein